MCVTTKKVSNDPKGGLREYVDLAHLTTSRLFSIIITCFHRYVHSMESQQTRLIEALRRLHRHVKQPIAEDDMREILQTVRACGFDFEGVQDIHYDAPESKAPPAGLADLGSFENIATNGFNENNATKGGNRNSVMDWATGQDCLGKRKRAEFGQFLDMAITPGSDVAVGGNVGNSLPDTNGGSDLTHDSEISPLKRQKPAAPTEPVNDSRSFDNYFDQVTTPSNPFKPPTPPGTDVSNPTFDASLQNVSNSLQQLSEMPAWSWSDLSQPLTTTDDDSTFEINGNTSTYPTGETSKAVSTFEAPHDWGPTMWWDPSLLFDTRLENSDQDGRGLTTQSLDASHNFNEDYF